MKLLILSQYFWPEEFKINDLALGMQERGHRVTVLTGLPNYGPGRLFPGYHHVTGPWHENWRGIEIVRTPLLTRGAGRGTRLALNYASFALSACLRAPAAVRGADAMFVNQPSPVTVGIPAVFIKRLWDIPIALWIQDIWPDSVAVAGDISSRPLLKALGGLVRWIYGQCDLVLKPSLGFDDHLREYLPAGIADAYLPQWAESHYRPVDPDMRPDIRAKLPRGFVILFAGNIGVAQSFPTVLAAAEKLRDHPQIRWAIVGDGRQREWVRQQIAARSLTNVFLLDRAPALDMPHYFAVADVLLLSLTRSVIFAATLPSKLQTYLACGRPILASIDGEAAHIVEESGAGIATAAENAAALAEAAQTLYALSPEQRAEMGQRGLTYSRHHFSRSVLLDRLAEMLKRLSRAR